MLSVVLIPAGYTEYDAQGRVQGTLDVPLSQDGLEQAREHAEALQSLNIDALYCGPCKSCEQTAEVVSDVLGLKCKSLDFLRNLDQGLWQGMLIDDVKEKQPKVYKKWREDPESVCPPEGETVEEARERLLAALKKLSKKHKKQTIALVLAEPLGSVLKNLLQLSELSDMWTRSETESVEPISLVVPDALLAK